MKSLRFLISIIIIVALSSSLALTKDEAQIQKATELRKQNSLKRLEDIFKEKIRVKPDSYKELNKQNEKKAKNNSGDEIQGAIQEKLINKSSDAESEIHAIVNPVDKNNILVSPIKFSGYGFSTPIYYTKDMGVTWKKAPLITGQNTSGGGDPLFTADQDGNLYFSWIELAISSSYYTYPNAILFTKSTNKGESWSKVDTIFSGILTYVFDGHGGVTTSGSFGDKQWLATDLSNSQYKNTTYCAFIEFKQDDNKVVVRKKLPNETTFRKNSVTITNEEFVSFQFSGIDVDLQGKVHAFFWGSKDVSSYNPDYYIWHCVSTDGGDSFSEPTEIALVKFPPSSMETVPSYLPQRSHSSPQYRIDKGKTSPFSGNIYAIWCANDIPADQATTYSEPFHIFFCRSTDNGNSWSEPIRVNNDNTSYRCDHYLPSIDVSPNGEIIATWYDGREAAYNTNVHHYAAISFDGGLTFKDNFKVSTQGSNHNSDVVGTFGCGDYNITVANADYAIPIWSDGRTNNGSLGVYAAFIPFDPNFSGVEKVSSIMENVNLYSIIPNPVQDVAKIKFETSNPTNVQIDIVNSLGQVVQNIYNGTSNSGLNEISFDVSSLVTGKYIVKLTSLNTVLSTSLMVVR